MGAVERIFIWETLFWFGQMWESEAEPHSHMETLQTLGDGEGCTCLRKHALGHTCTPCVHTYVLTNCH